MAMKQFNLKEYLANPSKKVVTRDGRNVRIICTDKVSEKGYPLVALVMNDGRELVHTYNMYGQFYRDRTNDLDLFFAPEKYEGWVNLYKWNNSIGCYVSNPFSSEEKAVEEGKTSYSYLKTVKIEWEA